MKLKCQLCGKEYHHLGSHIAHGHKITAREYKEQFELPYDMALITPEIQEKKRVAFERTREVAIANLFSPKALKHRFKKGHTGLRRVSEHERRVILERIKKVNQNKTKIQPCPVCKMKFKHIESHLYNAHRLISIK